MIIVCNNCDKKFDIEAKLIPDNGRLLQCNGCNHKWFFKKEFITDPVVPNKIVKHEEIAPVYVENHVTMEFLDNAINDKNIIEEITIKPKTQNNENIKLKTEKFKNKISFNILGSMIVFIISFIAIIIVLDTFQKPISSIIPNIEFLLYSLYETINDIILFLSDLI